MPSKILLFVIGFPVLFAAGCTAVREKPAPTAAAVPAREDSSGRPAASNVEESSRKPEPPPAPKSAPNRGNRSRSALPGLIGNGAKWEEYGRTLQVGTANPAAQQPVPIFRQAGTLASLRAALAETPAQPNAEFRNGVLTLTFEGGSNKDIAAAVKQALSVTGARTLRVSLQP